MHFNQMQSSPRCQISLGIFLALCTLLISTLTHSQTIPPDLRLERITQLPGAFTWLDLGEDSTYTRQRLIATKSGELRGLRMSFLGNSLSAVPSLVLDNELSCQYGGQTVQLGFSEAAGGLLGAAVDPNVGPIRDIYLTIADSEGDIALLRFKTLVDEPLMVNRSSCTVLLRVDRDVIATSSLPNDQQAAAPLQFGLDGQLYVALDDGGFANDSCDRAQTLDPAQLAVIDNAKPTCRADATFLKNGGNPNSRALLGKVLRLNVKNQALAPNALCGVNGTTSYSANNNSIFNQCPEVLARGVHRPLQIGIDARLGWLTLADRGVANDELSIVSVTPPSVGSGADLGWPCFDAESDLLRCLGADLAITRDPVLLFSRTTSQPNRGIAGGLSYRGPVTELRGNYIFASETGLLFFVRQVTGAVTQYSLNWPAPISRTPAQLGVTDAVTGFVGVTRDISSHFYAFTDQGVIYQLNTPAALFEDGFEGFGAENPRLNRAPVFTSTPVTQATQAVAYQYDALATDPDGDSVTYELLMGPTNLAIDSSTGRLSFVPSQTDLGLATVLVRARDRFGAETIQRYALDIRAPAGQNNPPRISSSPSLVTSVSSSYSYPVIATDPDNDTLSYHLLQNPAGMTINSATGVISYTPNQVASPTVQVEVRDGRGGTARQTFVLYIVAIGNQAPVFQSSPMVEVEAGLPYSYTAIATDPEGSAVTYSLLGAVPPGLSINATTGVLTWNTAVDSLGNYPITIRASDTQNAFATQTYTLAVIASVANNSYLGKKFWLLFQASLISDPTVFAAPSSPFRFRQIQLINPNAVPAQVTISHAGIAFNQVINVPAGATSTVDLPALAVEYSPGRNGIEINADQPIRVMAMHFRNFASDSTLIAPSSMLGTRYTATDHFGNSSVIGNKQEMWPGQVSILATEDNTEVRITPPATAAWNGLAEQVFVLNKGDSKPFVGGYGSPYVNKPGSSLSGSIIQSNKPIAVFGGSECGNTPLALNFCEFMTEQLWPDRLLGTSFIGMPVATRRGGEQYRIVASEPRTQVRINGRLVAELNQGEFFLTFKPGPQFIETTKPVAVFEYTTSEKFDTDIRPKIPGENPQLADPSMVQLPPLTHALRSYWLSRAPITPIVDPQFNARWVHEYVMVAMPRSALGSLQLKTGSNVTNIVLKDLYTVPLDNAEPWVTGWFELPAGATVQTHQLQANAPFIATQVGFAPQQAYSHAIGYLITDETKVSSLTVTPALQNVPVGDQACIDLKAFDGNNKLLGYVRFDVNSAALSAEHAVVVADGAGQAKYCYKRATVGKDILNVQAGPQTTDATIIWTSRPAAAPNQPPIFEKVSKLLSYSTTYDELITAIDPEGQPLTYSLLEAPTNATINSTNGRVQVTIAPPLDRLPAEINLTVQARDPGGLSATQKFTVTIIFAPLWQRPVETAFTFDGSIWKGPNYRGGLLETGFVRSIKAPDQLKADRNTAVYAFGSEDYGLTTTALDYRTAPLSDLLADNRIRTSDAVNTQCSADKTTLGSLSTILKVRVGDAFLGNSIVGRLLDTNNDNQVNASDDAMAISTQFGSLRVYNLNTGALVRDVPGFSGSFARGAIVDVAGDSKPEIILVQANQLAAYRPDGTVVWTSTTPLPANVSGSVEVADLDGDGEVELIAYGQVFNKQGQPLWSFPNVPATNQISLATIADLDGDNKLEVLYGNEVRRFDGTLAWNVGTTATTSGITRFAVANLDADAQKEVVALVQNSADTQAKLYRFEHNGARTWGPIDVPRYSEVMLADADGDSNLDVILPNAGREISSTSGHVLQSYDLAEATAAKQMIDLDKNGRLEIVRAGGNNAVDVLVNDAVRGSSMLGSGPTLERLSDLNLIDVDGDAKPELVYAGRDLSVWQPSARTWPSARDKRSYNDELDGVSSFGLMATPSAIANAQADIWLGPLQINRTANNTAEIKAPLQNLGSKAVLTPVRVRFYAGPISPSARVIGTATIPSLKIGESTEAILSNVPDVELNSWIYAQADIPSGQEDCSSANNTVGSHAIELEVGDSSDVNRTDRILFAPDLRFNRAVPVLDTVASVLPTTATVGRPYRARFIWNYTSPGATLIHLMPQQLYVAGINATIDPITADLVWIPSVAGTFSITPQVKASDQTITSAQQPITITVAPSPGNAPYFTSTPIVEAVINQQYAYDAKAEDPDSTVLTFSKISGPTGLTVSNSGQVRWTPSVLGSEPVVIQVTDGTNPVNQSYTINVVAVANQPPVIQGFDRRDFPFGFQGNVSFLATDPEGQPLTYELRSIQNGQLFAITGNQFSLRTFEDTVTGVMRVSDGVNKVDAPFTLQVWDADEPLFIDLTPRRSIVAANSTVDVQVNTRGLRGGTLPTLTVDGTPTVLDANGKATINAGGTGTRALMATVTQGIEVKTASANIFVRDVTDTTAPDVALLNITEEQIITKPVNVLGKVIEPNLAEWTLQLEDTSRPNETIVIQRGTSVGPSIQLATLDPTLIENGAYVLALEAIDKGGNIKRDTRAVLFDGNLKLGQFVLTLEEANISLKGIDLQLTRTYDSRRRNIRSDFGYGWTLGYNALRVRESKILGVGWRVVTQGIQICVKPVGKEGTVSVTMPDGQVEHFRARPFPECAVGANPQVTFAFDQIGKADGTLIAAGGPYRVQGLDLIDADGNPADPDTYLYTTPGLVTYSIKQNVGIFRIKDSNNNQVDFTYNGIFHSSGVAIRFLRDLQGRILEIEKPDGASIRYFYNNAGELVSAKQPNNDATTHRYYRDHYLRRNGYSDAVNPSFNRVLTVQEFNDEGRIVSVTDAMNKRTEFGYSLGTSVYTVKDRLGNDTAYQYDDRGNVVGETNAEGETTVRTYDAEDNELTVTDGTNRTTTSTYNRFGNKLTERENGAPANKITEMQYDIGTQQLTLQKDAEGRVVMKAEYALNQDKIFYIENGMGERTSFGYPSPQSDQLESIQDPEGGITRFIKDQQDRILRQTDANGYPTAMTYDAMGRLLTETKQRTNAAGAIVFDVTTNTYDAKGNLIKTVHPDGQTEAMVYDARNLLVEKIDALGRKTKFEYDPNGRKTVESQDFDLNGVPRHVMQWGYDELDREVYTIDPEGRVTKMIYDKVGRLVETIFPDATQATDIDNPRTKSTYDDAGRLLTSKDERGNVTSYEYDARGRQYKTIFADLTFVTTTFDEAGRRLTSTDPEGRVTKYVYDISGKVLETILPDATPATDLDNPRVKMAYDKVGRKTASIDEMGRKTSFVYDAKGQLVEVKEAAHTANPVSTFFEYDEVGNKLVQRDALGRETKWTYDKMGRELSRTLPMGQVETKRYDQLGRLVEARNFNGEPMTYTYDVLDRLTKIGYSDNADTKFSYFKNGLKKTVTEGPRTWAWNYDERDRLISEVDPDRTLAYQYDEAGNRTRLVSPAQTVVYEFDNRNRLSEVRARKTGETVDQVTTYGYTLSGNRESQVNSNGTKVNYVYNPRNQLTSLLHKTASNTILLGLSYQLDASGMRYGITESGQSTRVTSYQYDQRKRLVSEEVKASPTGAILRTNAFEYDAVGNRLKQTKVVGTTSEITNYIYDRNDRLTSANSASKAVQYSYNANGETTSQVTTVAGAPTTTSYGWDQRGRMVSSTANGSTTRFTYDPNGIRTSSTANSGTALAKTTRFIVDRNQSYAQVVEEREFNGESSAATLGGLSSVYTYGDDLLANAACAGASTDMTCAGADQRTLHYDGLGSTRFLSNSTGSATDTYAYEAFGDLDASGSSGSFANNYKFTGEQLDPNLGFYYLRARYMDPSQGRFVSQDSYLGSSLDPMSLHKYAYAHGMPTMATDPSGMFSINEIGAAQSVLQQLILKSVKDYAYNTISNSFFKGLLGNIEANVSVAGSTSGAAIVHALAVMCRATTKRCLLRGVPTFVGGRETLFSTVHMGLAMFAKGTTEGDTPTPVPFVLSKGPGRDDVDPRRGKPGCGWEVGALAAGLVCDEYPYASSTQGGNKNYKLGKVSLQWVPKAEGSVQGNFLKNFYRRAGVGTAPPLSVFLSVALPTYETSYIDRSGKWHKL